MLKPKDIQQIGTEIAIKWSDDSESYFPMPFLRKHSPSAENKGEVDILGRRHGGTERADYAEVEVIAWHFVGNYGIRFDFSDGHNTGIFSFDYLKELEKLVGGA